MKKLLSIILIGILAVSSFILTTFAAENEKSETEIEREKLGWLLDAFKILNTNIGEARIYNCVAGDTYNDAYNLYNQDELATAEEYKNMKDCLESKVFGIGLESYTVGSNEFCVGYSVQHQKLITIDTGHFHPTESAADKVSSMLLFVPELMLHVSRPIRWDSDHVTIMDDPTLELFQEIVRCNALDRVHIGLDYFDASINRIGAYVIGTRAAQKCMLRALLEPLAKLREYEAAGQGFQRLALLEEAKALPWNAVWDMFCLKNNVPVGEEFIAEIEKYEAEVTSRRN